MGADIVETDDTLIIKSSVLHGAECHSHHDHRVAMSCAIAALGAKNTTTVHDTDCVNKSYQHFVRDLSNLGCNIEEINHGK